MKKEFEVLFSERKSETHECLSLTESRKLCPNIPTAIVDLGYMVIKVRNVICIEINDVIEEQKGWFFIKNKVWEVVGCKLKAYYIDEFDRKMVLTINRTKDRKHELFDAAAILKTHMRTDYYDYALANFKDCNFDYK